MGRMFARSAIAVATATTLPACLTQNVQFDLPRNYPPSIESSPTARFPANEVIVQTVGGVPTDGGVPSTEFLTLETVVRDPNLEQRLQYRVFIDYRRGTNPAIAAGGDIPPSTEGDRLTRTLPPIRIPVDMLSRGQCHRIEVLVSSRFQDPSLEEPTARLPVEPGDLASLTYFVALTDNDTDQVDMRRCPR